MKTSTLKIVIHVDEPGELSGQRPVFLIDGHDLRGLVHVHELANFSDDASAGREYAPIQSTYWDNECYFTRPSAKGDFLGTGGALLLSCDCDEWGCWNLFCTIVFEGDVVKWKDFRKHHRDWKYDLEFQFDKQQYLEEFQKVEPILKGVSY